MDYDWLTNESADPYGYAGPQNFMDASMHTGFGAKMNNLFEDQNFIRMLGEKGAEISDGRNIMSAIGSGASEWSRRQAVQKAGAKSMGRQNSFQDQLLQLLQEGNLLSPKEDNDAPDSITIDGDGNYKINGSNTPQKVGFKGAESSLESLRAPMRGTRGNNLPNF